MREGGGEDVEKRIRGAADEGMSGDDAMGGRALHGACEAGLVTRQVPMGSAKASTAEAAEAIKKEMGNMLKKGVLDPSSVVDWDLVREEQRGALIGKAKMILGVKNSELPADEWQYKGRLVFMGNNIRGSSGQRVTDTADGLYGTPVSLATARLVLATALLRDWSVDVGDVEGAYLVAKLGGPPVYVRLSQAL